MARAFAWTEALESGRYVDITALANALEVDSAYIRRILDLANLSPALVEAIFRGEEPDGLSLARLRKGFPEAWCEQETALRATLEGWRSPSQAAGNVSASRAHVNLRGLFAS